MQKLNDIMWPAIRTSAAALLAEKEAAGLELVCMEAAVMIEAGWQDLFDEVRNALAEVKLNESVA